MERDCQHGLYKAGMGSSRVLSDFAEKYGSKNRVLAGFGIGGKSGKEKVYKLAVTEREADVVLGIRIKHESNGISISQSHYTEKVLKKFNYFDCTPVSTPIDTVAKLSRYTSNPSTQHWQALQRVLKYLKKTMDYSLSYTGYHSVLKGYTDASWISNTNEYNSSTSVWVYLLMGRVAIRGFQEANLQSHKFNR
ncbi:hypothetical protein Tco_0958048 [Tanacetum coccineum]